MTDSGAEEQIAHRYRFGRAWDDPERAAVRSTAEPMAMYVELARQSPVIRASESVTLLRMDDILFVNKHRDVETTSEFLGSNRPAIPLGLDGRSTRSTVACSTPCSQRPGSPSGPRGYGSWPAS